MGTRMCPKYNMGLDMVNCMGCECLDNENNCELQNEEWKEQQKKQSEFVTSLSKRMISGKPAHVLQVMPLKIDKEER